MPPDPGAPGVPPPGRPDPGVAPPGWPAAVAPPGHEDFPTSATRWLLDVGPPELRGHAVFRDYPLALAHVVAHHVAATLAGLRQAYAETRRSLADVLPPTAVDAVLTGLEREGARLAAREREVGLVAEALRGRRWRPRL